MSEDKANQISKCILCGDDYRGWGNNPEPVKSFEDGQCCNACNTMYVIPARLSAIDAAVKKIPPDPEPETMDEDEDGVGWQNDREH